MVSSREHLCVCGSPEAFSALFLPDLALLAALVFLVAALGLPAVDFLLGGVMAVGIEGFAAPLVLNGARTGAEPPIPPAQPSRSTPAALRAASTRSWSGLSMTPCSVTMPVTRRAGVTSKAGL